MKGTKFMSKHYYFTFISTYHAIKAEKTLSGKDWDFKMVPVPRSISSSCGTALRCSLDDAERIKTFLVAADVMIESEHELEANDKKRSFTSFFRKNKS